MLEMVKDRDVPDNKAPVANMWMILVTWRYVTLHACSTTGHGNGDVFGHVRFFDGNRSLT